MTLLLFPLRFIVAVVDWLAWLLLRQYCPICHNETYYIRTHGSNTKLAKAACWLCYGRHK